MRFWTKRDAKMAEYWPSFFNKVFLWPKELSFWREIEKKKKIARLSCVIKYKVIHQAQVVQTLDSTFHRINHYPADKY